MMKEKLSSTLSQGLDAYIYLYIDRPYHCFGGCCFLTLALTAFSVGIGSMNLTMDQSTAWNVHVGEFNQAHVAYQKAAERVEKAYDELSGDSAEDEEEEETENLLIYYSIESGDTVFTAARLRDMCRLEVRMLNGGDNGVCPQTGGSSAGKCPLISPIPLFYGSLQAASDDNCKLLEESEVEKGVKAIADSVAEKGSGSPFARMLTPAFVTTNRSIYAQSVYQVWGKDKEFTEEFVLREIHGGMDEPLSYGFLRSAFQGRNGEQTAKMGTVRVRLFMNVDEFDRMLPPDFSLAVASIIFVFITIYAHLGSLFAAVFGMWQIIASLPISGIVYRQVFRVQYFEFVHILIVYLVLGIGADDIFVLLDTWRHIKAEYGIQWGKGGVSRETMHKALKATWYRTATSIFNTSFTTAVAFASMSVSKVMPMRTCGYFAALCIVFCYILSITFTPSILMVHQLHFGGKRCCCPDPRKPAECSPADKEGLSDQGSGCFSGIVERMLHKVYLPLMQKRVGPIKPLPLFSVLVMAGVAIQGAYFSSQLAPPSKPEEWFPKSHMWTGLETFQVTTFYSPDYDKYTQCRIVWGLDGMDFSEFNSFLPDDYPGEESYDSSFDFSTIEAQQAYVDVCRELEAQSCEAVGCRAPGYSSLIFRSGEEVAISCVVEDFYAWLNQTYGVSEWLEGQAFLDKLEEFVKPGTANPEDYGKHGELLSPKYWEQVGFVDGRLLYVAILFRSTMPDREPYGSGIAVRDLVESLMDRLKPDMPEGMKSMSASAGKFANFDLGMELINGLFSGCAIAGPIVFLVLLLSTRNIVLALYAVCSVAGIVVSVLGFCKSAMDYDLGVGEAIAGVIVIGYSVDYVVHLAHIYREAGDHGLESREERAVFAVKNMGSTVFAGAITTAGAGMFMFFCFLTFFFKMALLICMTIFFSFLYALFFFMGLCFLVGPQGRFGNICCCLKSSKESSADSASHDPKQKVEEVYVSV